MHTIVPSHWLAPKTAGSQPIAHSFTGTRYVLCDDLKPTGMVALLAGIARSGATELAVVLPPVLFLLRFFFLSRAGFGAPYYPRQLPSTTFSSTSITVYSISLRALSNITMLLFYRWVCWFSSLHIVAELILIRIWIWIVTSFNTITSSRNWIHYTRLPGW